ncbi:MAG: hypothetical protein IJ734_07330 [Fibrobacter sp.]|nr:hypothetical protein [Fibrobacter sp.]
MCKSITHVLLLTLVMAVCAASQRAPGGEPDQPAATTSSTKIIRFMRNWTNSNAVYIYNGTDTIMSAVK